MLDALRNFLMRGPQVMGRSVDYSRPGGLEQDPAEDIFNQRMLMRRRALPLNPDDPRVEALDRIELTRQHPFRRSPEELPNLDPRQRRLLFGGDSWFERNLGRPVGDMTGTRDY